MGHSAVELSLQEEGDYEPVNTNDPVGRTLDEKEYQGADHRDGGLEAKV